MKVKILSLFLLFIVLSSFKALHLSNLSGSLVSEVPTIPTVKLITSFQRQNLRLAQLNTKYTVAPAPASQASVVAAAGRPVASDGNILKKNLMNVTFFVIVLFLF